MKKKLIMLAKSFGIDIEIYENKTNRTDINVTSGILKLFQINNVSSYAIKAIKNGKCIKFISDSIKDAQSIIDNINTIFAIQDNENKNILSKGKVVNKIKNKETLDYNQVKEDLLSLEDLKEKYPDLVNLELSYSHYDKGYYLDNENAKMQDEAYYNEYVASITLNSGEINRVAYISYYTKDYNFLEFKNYLLEKLNTLLIKIESDTCKTDKYRIILKNNAVASLLDTFVMDFDTKTILLKESAFQDKFKTKVFSDKITIVEDPYGEDAIVKRFFDNEGTKTSYKEIVSSGVFVKKINNLEYALKTGEEATGNAFGVNNLYIKPGAKDFESLVEALDNGIIIDEIYGLHSGVDEVSGNISVQAEGLLVENGKVVKGLNMIVLSTNIFEIFSNVLEVGNDLSKTSLDVNAPSLLLDSITIAGGK